MNTTGFEPGQPALPAFTYQQNAGRVLFGAGSLDRLPEEIERLGARKILVLSTPEQRASAEALAQTLDKHCVGVFDKATMHVPVEVAREAVLAARQAGADCAVALGGGSTIGLGKAIALQSDISIIAVPTTYAGSEMTPLYGITEDGVKKTGKDFRVIPKTVIYDVNLTLTLPTALSVTSGINAMAHAAEAMYAHDGNPIISLLAEEAIRALASGLEIIADKPLNIEARTQCQYGAWLAGMALGTVSMGLHHKLCHTLGGSFNLPHAETHAVMLPYSLSYNAPSVPAVTRRIANAASGNSSDNIVEALVGLYKRVGVPRSLKDIGFPADGIDRAVELAMSAAYPNPRPLEKEALRQLIEDAYAGRFWTN
jgi:maleylacetate reductase